MNKVKNEELLRVLVLYSRLGVAWRDANDLKMDLRAGTELSRFN